MPKKCCGIPASLIVPTDGKRQQTIILSRKRKIYPNKSQEPWWHIATQRALLNLTDLEILDLANYMGYNEKMHKGYLQTTYCSTGNNSDHQARRKDSDWCGFRIAYPYRSQRDVICLVQKAICEILSSTTLPEEEESCTINRIR